MQGAKRPKPPHTPQNCYLCFTCASFISSALAFKFEFVEMKNRKGVHSAPLPQAAGYHNAPGAVW